MKRRPPRSTLFPYATLFQSYRVDAPGAVPSEILPHPTHVDAAGFPTARSEEHTSELQSHSDLVCRLLLEKKKNTRVEVRITVVLKVSYKAKLLILFRLWVAD